MRTLKEVKCGESVSVVKLSGEGAVKRRIMDMGSQREPPSMSGRLRLLEIRSK